MPTLYVIVVTAAICAVICLIEGRKTHIPVGITVIKRNSLRFSGCYGRHLRWFRSTRLMPDGTLMDDYSMPLNIMQYRESEDISIVVYKTEPELVPILKYIATTVRRDRAIVSALPGADMWLEELPRISMNELELQPYENAYGLPEPAYSHAIDDKCHSGLFVMWTTEPALQVRFVQRALIYGFVTTGMPNE